MYVELNHDIMKSYYSTPQKRNFSACLGHPASFWAWGENRQLGSTVPVKVILWKAVLETKSLEHTWTETRLQASSVATLRTHEWKLSSRGSTDSGSRTAQRCPCIDMLHKMATGQQWDTHPAASSVQVQCNLVMCVFSHVSSSSSLPILPVWVSTETQSFVSCLSGCLSLRPPGLCVIRFFQCMPCKVVHYSILSRWVSHFTS